MRIEYMNSMSDCPTCFVLIFDLKEYIPENYFKEWVHEAELNFYVDILKKHNLLEDKSSNIKDIIWSRHYECCYNDIPFTMVFDKDWGDISFAVENSKYRKEIAEYLCSVIEKEKIFK